jgi:hypothetical protein
MPDYDSVVAQISDQTGIAFRPASPFDLAKLESLGLPESILSFYREFEPSEVVEQQVRLWPIEHILEENDALIPGCYSSRYGYIVFATTFCGDAYCFDTTHDPTAEPRIVLFSHEVVNERTTAAELARLAKPIAENLKQFLAQFSRNEVDQECIYS